MSQEPKRSLLIVVILMFGLCILAAIGVGIFGLFRLGSELSISYPATANARKTDTAQAFRNATATRELKVTMTARVISGEVTTTAETLATWFPTGEFFMPLDGTGHGMLKTDGLFFRFFEDGTFTVTDTAGVRRMSGTYVIDGDKYTETSSDLKSCEPAGPAPYRWTFEGQTLTFIAIGEDECVYRTEIMDGRELIKQE